MLPDCRAYEQVSPVEKDGFDAVAPSFALPAQAAPEGDAIAYLSNTAFPGSEGSTPLYDAHLANRGRYGWTTTPLTPPKTSSGPPGQYIVGYAFSKDLTQSVVDTPLQELASGATPGMYNLFLRNATGEYSLLNVLPPIVPPPGSCPERREPYCYASVDVNAFAGGSANFEDVLFESTAQYVPGAPAGESLYESALEGGQRVVRLVGYLPNGEAAEGSTAGGGSSVQVSSHVGDGRLENAISADGSRVVFAAAANGSEPYEAGQAGDRELYDRIEHVSTIELSAPSAGAKPADDAGRPARFWAASSDGSRVFFTSEAELTSEANTGGDTGSALYEYDLEAPSGTAPLRDMSLDSEAAGARVLGVLGASENGEYVYFVAEGTLTNGVGADGLAPAPHEPNLYLAHGREAPVFIATLDPSDDRDWTTPSEEEALPEAYVAPDGLHVAFTSVASLPTANFGPGYDNRIAGTGPPASEIYEYTAPDGEGGASGTLDCASCGASEGPPSGDALLGGVAEAGSTGTPFHQPRALSENGARVFFTAKDAAGGRGVYEYEHDGEGTCTDVAGCTFAISQPPAGAEDLFLDASVSGNDVFFATASQLVPGDKDALEDVYDARVEGGFAASSESSCETACHAPGASSIEVPVITSSTVGPSGNLPPRASATRRKQRKRELKARSKRKAKTKRRTKPRKRAPSDKRGRALGGSRSGDRGSARRVGGGRGARVNASRARWKRTRHR